MTTIPPPPPPPIPSTAPPTAPPILSTRDDSNAFRLDSDPPTAPAARGHRHLAHPEFAAVYEITRTIEEIVRGGYMRIALQFPDELLADSGRVYGLISRGLNSSRARAEPGHVGGDGAHGREKTAANCYQSSTTTPSSPCCQSSAATTPSSPCCQSSAATSPSPAATATATAAAERKVFILADTSYAPCCVDEIAAEHVCADVLVHYGRACLSPTTRLPVIYVFTASPLAVPSAVAAFRATFPALDAKVLLMADTTYAAHMRPLHAALAALGYSRVFPTAVVHDPASLLPNRTLPPDVAAGGSETAAAAALREYALFHVCEPQPSLQLILASRLAAIHCWDLATDTVRCAAASALLRRRYALVSHARAAGIVGILVTTLNIRHYLAVLAQLQRQIRDAGRKSYVVVVGKVNVEKIANFAEIEAWVGVGCWERGVFVADSSAGSDSSGGADGRGWWRPVLTPWELSVALGVRAWSADGGWIADFGQLLRRDDDHHLSDGRDGEAGGEDEEGDSDEDAPPEYDLRTGRYISTARPLRRAKKEAGPASSRALTAPGGHRHRELVAAAGGVDSPAALFLREKRTWQGLASDFEPDPEQADAAGLQRGALVEEGRSGLARGYVVGTDGAVH